MIFKAKIAMIEHKQGYSDNSLPSTLSQEEKTIYRAIACRIAVNEVILNEGLAIPQVCEEIDSKPKPDVPMLLFVSDGKENGGESWIEAQKEYAADLSDAAVIELDCGHYVHNFEFDRIAEEMREFMEGLGD